MNSVLQFKGREATPEWSALPRTDRIGIACAWVAMFCMSALFVIGAIRTVEFILAAIG